MQLVNVTRKIILAREVVLATSFGHRLKGLIGTHSLPADKAMLLRPCNSIHTLFMQYPIDAVFLDNDHRIIRILPALPPYRFSPLVRGAETVLELQAGYCCQTGTRVGDLLEIS
jgi:hypothetical protein